ncbi:MAG: non-homologous end-joining DNA ligase [Actinomycetota bacterium]|nr:non-homologous end-joining DNA ligase [Actinomycetota bacterium]
MADQAGDRLADYRGKRHFDRTAEPSGAGTDAGADRPRFVVQKHAASRLHYDVRLEADGVLVSWAVPKGPSYDPGTKRLAVHVEDHPLDYRDFEGTIPAKEYGGGAVIVWDQGTYGNLTERKGQPVPVGEAVRAGHLSVWLEGSKLRGGWAFTRTGGGKKESWILVKRNDEQADPTRDVVTGEPDSVTSGRSIDEVAGHAGDVPQWTADRATWQPPMLAQATKVKGISGERADWVYERKLDGLRTIAVRNGDDVELWSRNHQRFTHRFPAVVDALGDVAAGSFTIDGEIVAFDGERTSFGLLQRGTGSEPVYVAFDLLQLLGRDTTGLPLADRKRLLAQALQGAPDTLRTVDALDGDPARLLADACRSGWEGLVAKRAGSPYRAGRSGDWLKLKCSASQELVIGGWTDPSGSRSGLGALLLGYYDDDGSLRYAGKVGTGFNEAELRALRARLDDLVADRSPFADPVPAKGSHWSRPELVAAVSFTEWTSDGRLRHPSFDGLREDKEPGEVRRETGT